MKSVPPTDPSLPALLAASAYGRPFHRYQAMAFDAFEAARTAGRRRAYVVMPPGSGKTVVGLEIARRLGRPAVAFGPNTAIQSQWVRQAGDFVPGLPIAADTGLSMPLTALTYQSLCTLDPEAESLDQLAADEPPDRDGDDDGDRPETRTRGAAASNAVATRDARDRASTRSRRRRLIARGGTRAELLGLLHPNGRALFERIKALGEVTIILDECHHLLEMWGHLLSALVEELGDRAFVVGLTATPPGDMEAREAELYQRLFGRADFKVPTPAVVKEGDLAPYQELAFLTEPLPIEREYIAAQEERFQELTTRLLDPTFTSRPFIDWLRVRVVERRSPGGATLDWTWFESREPDLATAAVRLFLARGWKPPDGARVGERHRQPPTADDWALLIGDFCLGFLRHSDLAVDVKAWEAIRRALPTVGYILRRDGIRSYVSPIDRVLALSASKGTAVQTILDLERQQLGDRLRALVLCDFERAGVEMMAELRSVLDPQAGSAALVLQLLVADPATRALSPLLLTGRTVACSRATAGSFVEWCGREAPELRRALAAAIAPTVGGNGRATRSAPAGPDDIVELRPDDAAWEPRRYVPLLTRFFEGGGSRCLVGTRGLLGEGWDAHSVNVLVDLTAAATSTSVHQMRGRSLRLDENWPRKVGDNWDVVCIAPEHPKGTADYRRFVRKHHAYYALTAGGEIEAGVSHVDPVLSPFGPPAPGEITALNHRTLARIGQREKSYADWRIGEPYRNIEMQTVRIRTGRSIGLPGTAVARIGRPAASWPRGKSILTIALAAAVSWQLSVFDPAFAWQAAGLILATGLGHATVRTAAAIHRIPASAGLEDLGAAVLQALATTHAIDERLTPADLRVVPQADGYYRCYLEGASAADSAAFATALDELLAPLDDPRYVIGRRVVDPPRGWLGAIRVAVTRPFGRIAGRRTWHAVPEYLGANRMRVTMFEAAWHRWVGPDNALYKTDPTAVGVLAVYRGENPFAAETQLRTLWE